MYYVLIPNWKDKTIYDEKGLLLDDNAIDNLIDMLLRAKEKTNILIFSNIITNYQKIITIK